jgi:hypothetical protein
MKGNGFAAMSMDELWSLHEQVTSTLARNIAEEKARLEELCAGFKTLTTQLAPIGRAVPIRRSCRNIRTQKIRPRSGPAVESNRIGCRRSLRRAKSSSIFSLLDPQSRGLYHTRGPDVRLAASGGTE